MARRSVRRTPRRSNKRSLTKTTKGPQIKATGLVARERGDFHVVLIGHDPLINLPTIAIAPGTFAWVAVNIAEGVLQGVGAKIFGGVFGGKTL